MTASDNDRSGGDTDLYTTEAVSHDGAVRVADAEPNQLTIRSAQELGGPGGGWNPERLYSAALATCLHQSVVLVASSAGVDTGGCAVHAEVTLRKHGTESYRLDAVLRVELPGVADDQARERLVTQAAALCPLVTESQVTASAGTKSQP